MTSVSSGMLLYTLSCLQFRVLNYLRLKPILVDIHLRADYEHFWLVITIAFGLSAVDLLVVTMTVQRGGTIRDLHVLVPRLVLRRSLSLDV